MKRLIYLALVSALLASCQMQEVEVGVPAPDIMATVEADPATKTQLSVDWEGTGVISWMPADKINVFFGNTGAQYTSQNTLNTTTAVFRTSDSIGMEAMSSTNIWGLYPYNSNATCTGSAVTTTLPAAQAGVPETFDDDLYITLAHSISTSLQFFNVCSGIKFSLSRDDIKSVSFKGNDGEDIAGDISLSFEDNRPKATVLNGVKEITLTPKSGETFAKGVNYYIVTLPATLSKGFTITFTTTNGSVGTLNYTDKLVTLQRSIFSKKAQLDTFASFVDKSHEAIDLGLSVMWASCNVGASSPEEYGDYFAWGETEPKSDYYSWGTYKWCNGTSSSMTKYNTKTGYGIVDNKTQLDLSDDAAHVNCGDKWRMPTYSELGELITDCSWTWTTQNGVNGYRVTSKKNGNSIFLPATGYRFGSTLFTAGSNGRYWSSNLVGDFPDFACHVGFDSDNVSMYFTVGGRHYGLSVRPVYDDSTAVPVSGVSLDKTSMSMTVDETQTLTATVTPSNATDKSVTWSSSDPDIASVSGSGVVTANAIGTATITAYASNGLSASCKIDVFPYSDAFEEHDGWFSYGGVSYNTVRMKDGKVWMAENLRFIPKGYTPCSDLTKVDAGVFYPVVLSDDKAKATFGSVTDAQTQGYLYQSEVALGLKVGDIKTPEDAKALEGAQGICPEGWHIPTLADWLGLVGKSVGASTNVYAPYYDGTNGSIQLLNKDCFNLYACGAVSIQDNTKTSGTLMGKLGKYEYISSGYIVGSTYAGSTFKDDVMTNVQFYALMPMTNKETEAEFTANGSKLSYRIAASVRCVKN